MKYALVVLFSLFLVIYPDKSSARTITNFRDSDAITTIAQFMYDVAEDVPVSVRLTDKKLNIKDFSKCTDVKALEVLTHVESAIKKVLRYYPDEEIPVEQALMDMEDYLGHGGYKKCMFEKKSSQSITKSTYYVDQDEQIYVRLDNVLLTAE